MKRARLEREASTDEGTFGTLTLEGGPTLRTTELPWRENRTGVSCIPPGTYRCEAILSPKFGRVYEVRDVPGRSNILLHVANFGGDAAKGWYTELQGCIAPARALGKLTNVDGKLQRAGLASKPAFKDLMAWGKLLAFELEIR